VDDEFVVTWARSAVEELRVLRSQSVEVQDILKFVGQDIKDSLPLHVFKSLADVVLNCGDSSW